MEVIKPIRLENLSKLKFSIKDGDTTKQLVFVMDKGKNGIIKKVTPNTTNEFNVLNGWIYTVV